jgi:hypothetical protein
MKLWFVNRHLTSGGGTAGSKRGGVVEDGQLAARVFMDETAEQKCTWFLGGLVG